MSYIQFIMNVKAGRRSDAAKIAAVVFVCASCLMIFGSEARAQSDEENAPVFSRELHGLSQEKITEMFNEPYYKKSQLNSEGQTVATWFYRDDKGRVVVLTFLEDELMFLSYQ